MIVINVLVDPDCTPPDDTLCANVEDNPDYTIYHYHPCKLKIYTIYILFENYIYMSLQKSKRH